MSRIAPALLAPLVLALSLALLPAAAGACDAADLPEESALQAALGEAPRLEALGLEFAALTPELRDLYGLEEEAAGLVVVAVEDDSRAADQGVQPGDILHAAGMETATTLAELAARIAALRRSGDRSILLLLEQDGDMSFVDLPLTAAIERSATATGAPPLR